MAVATTTFTPAPLIFPYAGLDTLGGDRSAHPFAELRFTVLSGAVAVEAGGDSQKVDVTCNLPVNFAYTLMNAHYAIFGADIADWENGCDSFWTDGFGSGNNTRSMISPIATWNEAVSETAKVFRFDIAHLGVLLPNSPASQPQFRVRNANPVINGSVMAINFHARFLQFNIEQAYNFAVNSPTPTR